jgi:DnaJ family protein C protein 2
MAEVDKLAELLSLARCDLLGWHSLVAACLLLHYSLQDLNQGLSCGDRDKAKDAFTKEVEALQARMEKEKQELLEASQKSSKSAGSEGLKGKGAWSEEELQALIKGVNLFPAGTNAR